MLHPNLWKSTSSDLKLNYVFKKKKALTIILAREDRSYVLQLRVLLSIMALKKIKLHTVLFPPKTMKARLTHPQPSYNSTMHSVKPTLAILPQSTAWK